MNQALPQDIVWPDDPPQSSRSGELPDDVMWPDADNSQAAGPTILSDAADAVRYIGGGAYKGTGAMVRGIGKAAQVVGDYATTPVVNLLTGQQQQTRNLLDPAADALGSVGENLQAGIAPASKEAVKQSTPSGDLLDPSSWSFGENPSVRGYLLHGADLLGQMVPVVASAVTTAGAGPTASMIAGGAAGGAQGGGAAVEEARKAIDDLAAKGTIGHESAYYRQLIDEGRTPDEALAQTRDAAEKWAFLLTTPISALGGAASGALIHPASNIVARANLPVRVAGRALLGAAEEGAQEVGESIETKTGINFGAGTKGSLTEGTFADFVLGALGGAGPAAAGGALSRRESPSAHPVSGHAIPEDTVFPEEIRPEGSPPDRETVNALLGDIGATAEIRSEMERARNAEHFTGNGDVPSLDRKLLRKRGYSDDEISTLPPEQLDALVADVVEKPAEMMPAPTGDESVEVKAPPLESNVGLSQNSTSPDMTEIERAVPQIVAADPASAAVPTDLGKMIGSGTNEDPFQPRNREDLKAMMPGQVFRNPSDGRLMRFKGLPEPSVESRDAPTSTKHSLYNEEDEQVVREWNFAKRYAHAVPSADVTRETIKIARQTARNLNRDGLWQAANEAEVRKILSDRRAAEVSKENGGGFDAPAQRQLFKIGSALTPAAQRQRTQVEDELTRVIRRIAGKSVRVAFPDKIGLPRGAAGWGSAGKNVETAAGSYLPAQPLIKIAMADPAYAGDKFSTALHESFHHVHNKLLLPKERKLLEREMPRLRRYLDKHVASGLPEGGQAHWSDDLADYEVVAVAFEHYAALRAEGRATSGVPVSVREMFERLMELFHQVRNALLGLGFQTYEDVFDAAYEGEYARRFDRQEKSSPPDIIWPDDSSSAPRDRASDEVFNIRSGRPDPFTPNNPAGAKEVADDMAEMLADDARSADQQTGALRGALRTLKGWREAPQLPRTPDLGWYLARRLVNDQLEDAVATIPDRQPLLKRYAKEYANYIRSPHEEWQRLRAITFLYYLSGNLSSAAVNATQVPVITMPYLSQFGGYRQINGQIAQAYKDAGLMLGKPESGKVPEFLPEKAPADVREDLKKAWDRGILVPQVTHEQMGLAQGRRRLMRGLRKDAAKTFETLGLMFSAVERMNRVVTYIAAYRLAHNPDFVAKAKAQLERNPLWRSQNIQFTPHAFAEWVIDETHYRIGKLNRGKFLRGPGTAVFQFKSFTLNTLELMYRMMRDDPAAAARLGAGAAGRGTVKLVSSRKALVGMAAMLMMFGGLFGLPGGDDGKDLIEAAHKFFRDRDIDFEQELYDLFKEVPQGPMIAEMIARGPVRQLGIDVSRRVGMGNILPTETVIRDEVGPILGMPYEMLIGRSKRAIEFLKDDRKLLAAGEAVPNFIKNPIHAYSWATSGVKTKGRQLMTPDEITTTEALVKSLGFQPTSVARKREVEWSVRRASNESKDFQARYYKQLGRALAKDDTQEVDRIFREIDAYNAKRPTYQWVVISPDALRKTAAEEMFGTEAGDRGVPRKARERVEEIRQSRP